MYAPPWPVTPWVVTPQDRLVKAVGFLDAVRDLRFKGQSLIKLHSAERTARLASDADDAEAFDSRIATLSDLLAHLQVHDVPVLRATGTHLPGLPSSLYRGWAERTRRASRPQRICSDSSRPAGTACSTRMRPPTRSPPLSNLESIT